MASNWKPSATSLLCSLRISHACCLSHLAFKILLNSNI
ncbi:hypothetical protein COLO4_04396 [Corchorus olitorius]|uniref:Uncharacterized protein n=1 Tax=Corchorus olitorius TaxID=93759 RepID=A0A1R3KU76_9ROSI|nr:hypothetical protein COLO4_04397 [Corchorus olitorius]OMP10616.1 hypothetical protein COLO4_04396 [Corchorus olitorius]